MKFCSYPLCARYSPKSKKYCNIVCKRYHQEYLEVKKNGNIKFSKDYALVEIFRVDGQKNKS
jgi:hypothetical protein